MRRLSVLVMIWILGLGCSGTDTAPPSEPSRPSEPPPDAAGPPDAAPDAGLVPDAGALPDAAPDAEKLPDAAPDTGLAPDAGAGLPDAGADAITVAQCNAIGGTGVACTNACSGTGQQTCSFDGFGRPQLSACEDPTFQCGMCNPMIGVNGAQCACSRACVLDGTTGQASCAPRGSQWGSKLDGAACAADLECSPGSTCYQGRCAKVCPFFTTGAGCPSGTRCSRLGCMGVCL